MSGYPDWICHDCGVRHGYRVPEIVNIHMDPCGWCGNRTMVSEPRDYGYPPFGGARPASAIEARQRTDPVEGLDPKGESAVPDRADAQKAKS